jgi:hypothetical protein
MHYNTCYIKKHNVSLLNYILPGSVLCNKSRRFYMQVCNRIIKIFCTGTLLCSEKLSNTVLNVCINTWITVNMTYFNDWSFIKVINARIADWRKPGHYDSTVTMVILLNTSYNHNTNYIYALTNIFHDNSHWYNNRVLFKYHFSIHVYKRKLCWCAVKPIKTYTKGETLVPNGVQWYIYLGDLNNYKQIITKAIHIRHKRITST